MSPKTSTAPPVPRPSASLVIVNANDEVLLVQRNPKSSAFAGFHVFPGGNYDAAQDASPEMTAIRETFEEAGLLIASSSKGNHPTESVLTEARKAVHAQNMSFGTFLSNNGLEADASRLLPFSQWITPVSAPKRFHTHFFLTFLDDARGGGTYHLPTSDGGLEIVATRFIKPAEALAACHAQSISLMPPQYYILSTLAGALSDRRRVEGLARGPFGRMLITPRALPEKDAEGRTILTYEGDESRGGPKGRLHRSLIRWGPRGVTTEITLQRNFDVFTELENASGQAKL